jgi:hypothetical protein
VGSYEMVQILGHMCGRMVMKWHWMEKKKPRSKNIFHVVI